MNPNLGDAKVDKILSQFSQKYTNKNYICEMILPPLKVKEKTGSFAKYGTENLRTYADQIFRAPGVRAKSVDYSVSQGSYICRERSLEKRVPDEFKNNTDDPYDAKRDAVATIMDNIWVNQERALQQFLTSTSNITNNDTLVGGDQWSEYSTSDPIDDIETGINTMIGLTGRRPNMAWMGHDVFTKLKYHPDIREQIKYTNGGQLSDNNFAQAIKDFFQLKEIFIGTAIFDSADEGQTASIAQVWTKDFWLGYKTERPTLMDATLGYTFYDVPRIVDTYREESHKSDVVRQAYSYDQNIMDVNLIYLIKNAIA